MESSDDDRGGGNKIVGEGVVEVALELEHVLDTLEFLLVSGSDSSISLLYKCSGSSSLCGWCLWWGLTSGMRRFDWSVSEKRRHHPTIPWRLPATSTRRKTQNGLPGRARVSIENHLPKELDPYLAVNSSKLSSCASE